MCHLMHRCTIRVSQVNCYLARNSGRVAAPSRPFRTGTSMNPATSITQHASRVRSAGAAVDRYRALCKSVPDFDSNTSSDSTVARVIASVEPDLLDYFYVVLHCASHYSPSPRQLKQLTQQW